MVAIDQQELQLQQKMKKPNFAQIATSRSLKSEVDLFSKFEVNFLEKYLRCIITDHFNKYIINIHEEYFYKKFTEKITKTIAASLFQLTNQFEPQELLKGLTDYFKQKSASVSSGVFPLPVKLVHLSQGANNKTLKGGELMYVDVRIRVEVARIQQIPLSIQTLISKFSNELLHGHDKKFQDVLISYKGQYLNLVLFYYGDIHFNFKRQEYQIQTIKIGNRQQKVKLYVFYISKIAMFQTFRTTNRVNVECINDLVISFYDIKREKKLLAKQKNRKQNTSERQPSAVVNPPQKPFDFRLLLGAGGAVCLGLLLVKMFS